jgi:hypothetical protein
MSKRAAIANQASGNPSGSGACALNNANNNNRPRLRVDD